MGTRINRHRFLRAQSDEQLSIWRHDARNRSGQFATMPDSLRMLWWTSILAELATRGPLPEKLDSAA